MRHAPAPRTVPALTLTAMLLPALTACAAAPGTSPADAATPAAADRDAGPDEAAADAATDEAGIPAGYGTLRQEDVTVTLRDGALQIKVTPLAEGVIRLTAPDTYRRLHTLAESRRTRAARDTGLSDPTLFLVSFFSLEANVPFRPDDVTIAHRGRVLRPEGVLPVTPGWGRQEVGQRETLSAVYAFEPDIDFDATMTIRYGTARSDAWTRIIDRLEVERSRVRSRTPGA